MNIYKGMFFLLVTIISLAGCKQSAPNAVEYGKGIVYEQINYGGKSLLISSGTSEPDIMHPEDWYFGDPKEKRGQGFTDTISSIRIGAGIQCEFYKDAGFKGEKLGPLGEGNYPDLKEKGWKEKIRSIQCTAVQR
jgi:Beta/Gamma crystallin